MAGIAFGSTLLNVLRAARSHYDKNFANTQGRRNFAIMREVEKDAQGDSMPTALEWTIRRAMAENSTGNYEPFGSLSVRHNEYTVSLSAQIKHMTSHHEMVFDELVMASNRNNPNKLFDLYKEKRDANEEALAEAKDTAYYSVPYSTGSSGWSGLLGWLYWFGRSMTSGGVFTSQPVPAYNGVYTRLGDGTITSSAAGADRASADNVRLRTLVATHGGVVDDTMLQTIRDAALEQGFEYLPGMAGDTSSELKMFWSDSFNRQFQTMMSQLGGPRVDDYFKMSASVVQGMRPIAAAALNGHFLAPIFLIKPSKLYLRKANDNWGKERPMPVGPTSYAEPRTWSMQFKNENPRDAGALIHGSFTTGL